MYVCVCENAKRMWKNNLEKVALLQMEKIIRMFIENVQFRSRTLTRSLSIYLSIYLDFEETFMHILKFEFGF